MKLFRFCLKRTTFFLCGDKLNVSSTFCDSSSYKCGDIYSFFLLIQNKSQNKSIFMKDRNKNEKAKHIHMNQRGHSSGKSVYHVCECKCGCGITQ